MSGNIKNYKICLIGDGGVGKTTFVQRHLNNIFDEKYIATLGVEVHLIRKDNTCFNLWDCAGQEKFGGLRDGYYINSQGVIFFFDLTNKLSLINLKNWINSCYKINGNIPCVIVGLKSDIPGGIEDEVVRTYIGNIPYVKVSSKNEENLDEPFNILKSMLP